MDNEGSSQGGTPESVPWNQYVATKESLGRKVAKLEAELEESQKAKLEIEAKLSKEHDTRLKVEADAENLKQQNETLQNSAGTSEEVEALKKELSDFRAKELDSKRKTVAEKYGLKPEKVADLNSEELDKLDAVLAKEDGEETKGEDSTPKGTDESKPDFQSGDLAIPTGSIDKMKAGFEQIGVK